MVTDQLEKSRYEDGRQHGVPTRKRARSDDEREAEGWPVVEDSGSSPSTLDADGRQEDDNAESEDDDEIDDSGCASGFGQEKELAASDWRSDESNLRIEEVTCGLQKEQEKGRQVA